MNSNHLTIFIRMNKISTIKTSLIKKRIAIFKPNKFILLTKMNKAKIVIIFRVTMKDTTIKIPYRTAIR